MVKKIETLLCLQKKACPIDKKRYWCMIMTVSGNAVTLFLLHYNVSIAAVLLFALPR